jgi:predicted nucleotide-binding protein (sugar kinase/HSP70/actin superfamily)
MVPSETRDDFELGQKMARGCECLPMRTVIGCFLNTIKRESNVRHGLFMPTAKGPCRFGQYATLSKQILDSLGYNDPLILSPSSENTYSGLSEELRRTLWKAILAGDLLYKMALKVRPYENRKGETDEVLGHWTREMIGCLEQNGDLKDFIHLAGRHFSSISVTRVAKPLVGVVGEIYVRNNVFSNENVIRRIEEAGGEAWMTPFSEWILYTAEEDVRKFKELPKNFGETVNHGRRLMKARYLNSLEHAYYEAAGSIIADRIEPHVKTTLDAGKKYLPFNIGGEAILSLGRAIKFAEQGASLVVNASPFSCMAGTVSAALFARIESDHNIPVLNLFYEGRGEENDRLDVFLANLKKGGVDRLGMTS